MSSKNTTQNYYELLEVPIDAPHHFIVSAYQRAKEAYSPESPALYTIFTKEEADEIRKMVEEAFLILGNQSKRKEYDQLLLNRGVNPTHAKALPDFGPVRGEPTNTTSEFTATAHKSTIPEGFAKSRLSVYEIKPELESEISACKNFDGAFIRKIRQYKNINIDHLSKETRISRNYLAALEAEDFEALPAPVFLRGFVVQVARMLGLDENQVANSYMSRVKKD
ncbi:MAG: helix-turn-helix domain-containing protein [Bdellovibrionales bacterium]